MAVEAGADALGFIFFEESKRYIPPAEAARIISKLPPFLTKVGVFVNASQKAVEETISLTGINTLQFHGEESAKYCAGFSLPTIKAMGIRDPLSIEALKQFSSSSGFLLDAYVPGQRGGTGATFNWKLALEAKLLGKPIILAGGLTPENISRAVSEVAPYAVDVSSGVEIHSGKKDLKKVHDFIHFAKLAKI